MVTIVFGVITYDFTVGNLKADVNLDVSFRMALQDEIDCEETMVQNVIPLGIRCDPYVVVSVRIINYHHSFMVRGVVIDRSISETTTEKSFYVVSINCVVDLGVVNSTFR